MYADYKHSYQKGEIPTKQFVKTVFIKHLLSSGKKT